MIQIKKILFATLTFLFLCAYSAPKDVDQEAWRDVAKDLKCPTCTGLSVLESDATFSVQIKDEIAEQMRSGKNKTQIINFFVDRYGPWILREPPKTGIGAFAWLIPILVLVVGPFIIYLRVWRRRPQEVQGNLDLESDSAVLLKMKSELQKIKGN